MRKIIFTLLFLILASEFAEAQVRRRRTTFSSVSQRRGQVSFFLGGGLASYYGDLKAGVPLWAKPSITGGAMYRVHPHVSLRAEALWYRITGDDSRNEIDNTIYYRNLSFQADNFEASFQVLGYAFDKYSRFNRAVLNPYMFAGLGFTTNNPKAQYSNGEYYSLRELATERTSASSDPLYGPVAMVVPFGMGVTFYGIRAVDISIEGGVRYTTTDYLDDASTNYADPSLFGASQEEQKALYFSDRRQKSSGPFTSPGNPYYDIAYKGNKYRGDPTDNDWYFVSSIKVVYVPGASTGGTRKRGGRLRRPKFNP